MVDKDATTNCVSKVVADLVTMAINMVISCYNLGVGIEPSSMGNEKRSKGIRIISLISLVFMFKPIEISTI